MIAVDALPLFEAEARERQREAGRETAERRRPPGQLEANVPQVSHRAPQARDRAAAATGVSGRTVQTAKTIKERAPRPGRSAPRRHHVALRRREGDRAARAGPDYQGPGRA